VWDDGTGYQMLLDEDAIAYGTIIPETGGLTTSGDASAETYAEFEYKIPENADGAMTTQNIVLENSITILIPAGVYDWCITNPTPGDRIWIASSNGPIPGRYDDFEFVSGAAYEFVVSLGGENDQVELVIDDPTAPTIPTNVTADAVSVDGTTATIAWVPGENNASWNLRWRPYVDPASVSTLWDLPIVNGSVPQASEFSIYDADGDGNNWGLAATDQAATDAAFYSASFSGSALTPDNWLFTPAVGLGGTLKFDAWQYSASWPDKFMVYVCDNPDWESVDEFVPVSEFIIPTGTTPESFEIDLSEYEGMGVIAFRHYDCTDQFRIYLDNIEVIPANAVEIPDWTVVEDVANPYTIEGLMPETKYEAQVQAVGEDARTTDWTESVLFTTEVGAEPETGFFLVGTFNEWNQTEEGGRIAFDNENRAEVQLEAGAEFKIITPAEDGGWIWLGGVDDNNVGYFLITPELLSHNLTLVDGANFRVEEGGLYHVNLVWNRDMPNYIVVTLAEPNAISTVGVDKTDNVYYNLLGVKFNGMPTTPGIYINNGKKVIIK
jgi:hypothetical protein